MYALYLYKNTLLFIEQFYKNISLKVIRRKQGKKFKSASIKIRTILRTNKALGRKYMFLIKKESILIFILVNFILIKNVMRIFFCKIDFEQKLINN